MRPWTQTEVDRACGLRAAGLSARQIARVIGRTRCACIGRLYRGAVVSPHPNPRLYTADEVDTIIRMWNAGQSAREIAAAIRRPLGSIHQRLAIMRAAGVARAGHPTAPPYSAQEIATIKGMASCRTATIAATIGRSVRSVQRKLLALRECGDV